MIITNDTTLWSCYKDPNSPLVYFIHSKCACSFYKQLFKKLNWIQCSTRDINWKNDLVFSYTRNPIIKHRTGIIEWFFYNKKTEVLDQNKNNNDFFSMLAEIVYLDIHSMSIHEHLGENSFNVQWIPIDQPDINHVERTIQLLKQHSGIPVEIEQWFLNLPKVHVSTGFKRECIDRLLAIAPTPLLIKSLEMDQVLYDKASIIDFEPATYPFRIIQLLENGHTQEQAEKIADQEVLNGNWQKWTNH